MFSYNQLKSLSKGVLMPDISNNTSTSGRLDLNGYATSIIGSRGDQDWFRIHLNAGQQVRFDLEGSPTGRGTLRDTYLRGIYNSSGRLISGTRNDDGGTGLNSRVTFAASSSGYYYVSAGAWSSRTGSYRLTATALNTPTPPSPVNPTGDIANNTGTSGRLTLGSYATSTIGSRSDQDWFRIHLDAGQQVRFDLEGSPTNRGTLRDTYLRGIYNSSGNLISGTRNDDGGTGYNSRVTFTASSSGDYYVSAGAFGSRTGTYRLTATSLGTITPDISNNTSTSGRLNLDGYAGSDIGSRGDQDWFRIHLDAGQQVRFDLEGSPTNRGTLRDTYLRGIYNSSGSLISGTRNDDGGTGLNSRVTFTASSSGHYYIAAGAFGSRTGTYRLTATALNTPTPSPFVPIDPDLIINNFSLSNTTIRQGDSVSVNYTVNNRGNGSTDALFSTAFYLSTDSSINTSDTLLTTDDIAALSTGSMADRNYNLLLPNSLNLSAGTYYIGAIADYNNAIIESNESNNTSDAVRITIPEIRPDLTIDNFSLSNTTITD
jgi:hypothetical protein